MHKEHKVRTRRHKDCKGILCAADPEKHRRRILYLEHFGLHRLPFENTPDPAFFFTGSRYRDILALLMHSTVSRKGLMCITGPVGSGKTMISAALAEHVPAQTRIIRLSHPSAAREELLPFLADSLEISASGAGTLKLTEKIRENLKNLNETGKQCLLIIDDAHLIRKEFFQEILVLSNLETHAFKLLQILLLGQKELAGILAQPDMCQIMQRLAVSANLDPMNTEQSLRYIAHRLKVSGGSAEIFSSDAADALIRISEGIPRNINRLCDASLLNAFVAGHPKVKETDFRKALENMGFRFSRPAEIPHVPETAPSFLKPDADSADQKKGIRAPENTFTDTALTGPYSGEIFSAKKEKKLPEYAENETCRESVFPKPYPEHAGNAIREKFSAERTKTFSDSSGEAPRKKSRLFFRIILSTALLLSIALLFMIYTDKYMPQHRMEEICKKWFAEYISPKQPEIKETSRSQESLALPKEQASPSEQERVLSVPESGAMPAGSDKTKPAETSPAVQESGAMSAGSDKTKKAETSPAVPESGAVPAAGSDKTKPAETAPVSDKASEKKESLPPEAADAEQDGFPLQWDEETMNEDQDHAVIEKYPYSVQMASFRKWEKAEKAFANYRKKGFPVYWVKTNREDGKSMFCIFAGIFEKRKDAEMFISSRNAEGAVSVRTSYAGLVKVFASAQEASEYAASLTEKGYSFYVINRKNGKHYLYTGAFRTPEGAQELCDELISKNIGCRVVTR